MLDLVEHQVRDIRLDPKPKPKAEEVSLDEVDQHVGVLDRDFQAQLRR